MRKIMKNRNIQKIALGLMITAISPIKTHASESFEQMILKAQPGFKGVTIRHEDAKLALTGQNVKSVVAMSKAPTDDQKESATVGHVDFFESLRANPDLAPEEHVQNATVNDDLVAYSGEADKEHFKALLPEEKKKHREELKIARDLEVDIANGGELARIKQVFVDMEAEPTLQPKKLDIATVKIVDEEAKAGRRFGAGLNVAQVEQRVALHKAKCRDTSPEALASLGHINANDLTHIEFDAGQPGYVGGDKNLNIETLAAFAKAGNNDPAEADFIYVRDIIESVNADNDSGKYAKTPITGNLVTMALHVRGLTGVGGVLAGFAGDDLVEAIVGYDYLVNCLHVARADIDADAVNILKACKDALKILTQAGMINIKTDSFHAINPDVAAAAIELELHPALAGKVAADINDEDLEVVAEAFRRRGAHHIGRAAGLGFDADYVENIRILMFHYNKKPAEFNDHHIAAVNEHCDDTPHADYIANASWDQIDASATLRAAARPTTVNNVNDCAYLKALDKPNALGIDPTNLQQMAAVRNMQALGFNGGAIAKPSEAEIIQYVALQAAGIARNKANVQASAHLRLLPGGHGINPVDPDQVAAVAAMQDAAFDGGTIPLPTWEAVIQGARLHAAGVALKNYRVSLAVALHYGVSGGPQIIANPDLNDIKACKEIDEDARGLGIKGLALQAPVIAAVKHLRTIGALAGAYTRDHITLTMMLQRQLPATENGGVAGPNGLAAPAQPQIEAVFNAPTTAAKKLVSWKIQKEEVAGHGGYVPRNIIRFLANDDGTGAGHAEFEVVQRIAGAPALTAAARVAGDNKFKYDAADLPNLTDGRGGTAAPVVSQLYIVDDLRVDVGDAARVTFHHLDRKPS
jgi:hypothetical protein